MVRDLTPAEFVQWLVEYHGLPAESANTAESNLREQLKWHRLQGRVERGGVALVIAEMLCMRRTPMILERQQKTVQYDGYYWFLAIRGRFSMSG
jgi:hypothetical protein